MGRGYVDFERGLARLASYARIYGHANPKYTEVWLGWTIGLWVSNLRTKFRNGKLTAAQISELESLGMKLTRPYRRPRAPKKRPTRAKSREQKLLGRLSLLLDYFNDHGHINIR